MLGIWPPSKGGRPSATRESGSPIWRCKLPIIQSENWTVSARGKFCETIASDKSDPGSKIVNQIPQDNQQERGITN